MLYLDYDNVLGLQIRTAEILTTRVIISFNGWNTVIKLAHPDIMMIAEESSSATKITGMKEKCGLGFDYKWNMGWMNDILRFYEEDPIYRKYDFNLVDFQLYVCFQ